MGKSREGVAAFKAMLQGMGATEFKFPLATGPALELAAELADEELQHPVETRAAAIIVSAAMAAPIPEDFEGRLKYTNDLGKVCAAFWDAFEGQQVEGVTIIRRRA